MRGVELMHHVDDIRRLAWPVAYRRIARTPLLRESGINNT